MTSFIVRKVSELSQANSNFQLLGFTGTALASSTTDIDYQVTHEFWLTGVVFSVEVPMFGDSVCVQLLAGEVVVGEFAKNFYVRSDSQLQTGLHVPYVALLTPGLTIRFKYKRLGVASTKIAVNFITHIPKDTV